MTCMLTKSNQLAVTAARVVTDMINDINQTNKHTHVRTHTISSRKGVQATRAAVSPGFTHTMKKGEHSQSTNEKRSLKSKQVNKWANYTNDY